MEKAFHIQLISYSPIFRNASIKFKEDVKTLMVGNPTAASGYVIHVSCRTLDTVKLLQEILPVLKNTRAAYRVIKTQQDQYRLNAGAFGDDEAGKVVSIFPYDIVEAQELTRNLCELTGSYKGPVVMNSQRIGNVVYVQAVEIKGDEIILSMPRLKNFPFTVNSNYFNKKNRLGLIGRYYLPVQLLRASAKGSIYKAINLKRMSFEWCLIKQGNPVALDDHFDRDMKDRLLWQKEVAEDLKGKVYTPHVLDFFTQGDYHYLVLNFAEGISLGNLVREKLSSMIWIDVPGQIKSELLGLFIQAAEIVQTIHGERFVHRDITDSNFILLEDGKLCIIDFELSYSLKNGLPSPPFLLGTFGYCAPEQIQHAVPDQTEDIYSLGALLCFMITGCKTWEFITSDHNQLRAKLMRLTNERELTLMILKCLSVNRSGRPGLKQLIDTVNQVIIKIKPIDA